MLIGRGCELRVTHFEVCMLTVADCVLLGKFINGLLTRIRIFRTMFASQTCTSMQRYEFHRWETAESRLIISLSDMHCQCLSWSLNNNNECIRL